MPTPSLYAAENLDLNILLSMRCWRTLANSLGFARFENVQSFSPAWTVGCPIARAGLPPEEMDKSSRDRRLVPANFPGAAWHGRV